MAIVGRAADELFGKILSKRAPGAREVAALALCQSRYAAQRKDWKVGRDSVLLATFSHGPNNKGKASWAFCEWLEANKPKTFQSFSKAVAGRMNSPEAVAAADRQWICTSFENRYKDFEGQAPDAGRPVGYLFLEKIFQVSTTLPTMSPALRERYWSRLVAGPRDAAAAPAGDEAPAPPPAAEEIREAVEDLVKNKTYGGLQRRTKSEANPQIKRELVRAAAEHLASPIVQQRTESRLGQYPQLMDANPRAMKRLLSAVTMTGARMMTEEREVTLEEIARWAALELRWPLLAARIARYPALLPPLSPGETRPFEPRDDALDALLEDEAVRLVIGSAPGDPGALTRDTHKKLLG